MNICGVISECGPFGEPIACGYPVDHEEEKHSWATLPTFVQNEKGQPEVVWYKTVG